MSELLDRVACAISGAPFPSKASLRKARAALEAMKQADGEMTKEGAEAINPYANDPGRFRDNVEIALDVWEAMIAEALK